MMGGINSPVLLIDIGNSTTVMTPYRRGEIGRPQKFPTAQFLDHVQAVKWRRYQRLVISSVVPSIDRQICRLKSTFPPMFFVTTRQFPWLDLAVDKPNQVGTDRVVTALGAIDTYKRDCLVIDSGTAITFCRVTAQKSADSVAMAVGTYHGGAIFPGMGISSRALQLYTEKVPLIRVAAQSRIVGKTTREAVQAGLYWGYIDLINGMIHRHRQEKSDIHVVGTGQGLSALVPHLNVDCIDEMLMQKGLIFIAERLAARDE